MGILDGLMQAQSSGKDTVKKVGIGGFLSTTGKK